MHSNIQEARLHADQLDGIYDQIIKTSGARFHSGENVYGISHYWERPNRINTVRTDDIIKG